MAVLAVLLAGGAAWLLADGIPRPGWLALPDAVPARETAPAEQDTGEEPEVSGEGGEPVGGGGEPEGTTGRTPVETSEAPPEYPPERTPDTHTGEPEGTHGETGPPTTTETRPSPEPSGTGDASPAVGEVPSDTWPGEEGTA